MNPCNYVVTAHKPTSITQSCAGNFTGPNDCNLMIGKCTRIEIHLLTREGEHDRLKCMVDLPTYGTIVTLEFFRPRASVQEPGLLFVVTEDQKYLVLQWDVETSEVITRESASFFSPVYKGQICIIDHDHGFFGLHFFDDVEFTICRFKGILPDDDDSGNLNGNNIFRIQRVIRPFFNIKVLDIKFLYGFPQPTIAVLYKDVEDDALHVKSIGYFLDYAGVGNTPWSKPIDLNYRADLLVPVKSPHEGFLIIGERVIEYHFVSYDIVLSVRSTSPVTKASTVGIVDDERYLLGDHAGLLYLVSIKIDDGGDTTLQVQFLGHTPSITANISCLDGKIVFLGSSYGDSQLIKLNLQPVGIEVLDSYVNLGPIVDFCVEGAEGREKVVTCSGAYKGGSLHIIRNEVVINEQGSFNLKNDQVTGMWSLRAPTDDVLLVFSLQNSTSIWKLEKTVEGIFQHDIIQIGGFDCNVPTLFCHDVKDQLLQVTKSSIKLLGFHSHEKKRNRTDSVKDELVAMKLKNEWKPPKGCSIVVATSNNAQVLLSVTDHRLYWLFYLEINDGTLTVSKQIKVDNDISCLDINPVGENTNSKLAAVGIGYSVRIYSVPGLELMTKIDLGPKIPHSVLLCYFEGTSYLLCGLRDGCLLNFLLTDATGELMVMEDVSLGKEQITVGTFSSKNTTHVFAASKRSAVIYSSNRKLLYSHVDMKDIRWICHFNSVAFPDRLAILNEDNMLTIGTIDQKFHRSMSIPLGEGQLARHICHQEQTQTYAICSFVPPDAEESEKHFVRLLDDQTLEFTSSQPLQESEYAYSLLSCTFSNIVYYCVGTAYLMPGEMEPIKGRILVFTVEGRKLKTILEKETEGAVYTLNTLEGGLLASVNHKIKLYKWMSLDDGCTIELQYSCAHIGNILPLHVRTIGNIIVIGDAIKSMSVLEYKPEGVIKELAQDCNTRWMSAVEILDINTYLGAERNNIFINAEEVRGRLDVVGEYHLGDFVNTFREGPCCILDPEGGEIQRIFFGTVKGMIGVIAILPCELYGFLERLQKSLRKVINGLGHREHECWRKVENFMNGDEPAAATQIFLDGDLIEGFLDLNQSHKNEVSTEMGIGMEELCNRVRVLKRLRCIESIL